MKIIINCDDLGMNPTVNEAIFDLMREGRVTSATMMMNGEAVEGAAARIAEFPRCSFGVHLNGTEFRPLTSDPALGPLLNSDGDFAGNLRNVAYNADLRDALFGEWSAQVERARELGVPVSHIDSHHHVHTHPAVFTVLKRVQRRFGIRKVRLSRNVLGLTERLSSRLRASKIVWNLALRHYVPTVTTRGFGAFATFHERLTAGHGWDGSIELMAHPGGDIFAAETNLLWTDWKDRLARDAQLISYNDLR